MLLSGKHAVVTGGGSGIGLAIAKALVQEGAHVTIMGRNMDRLSDVASKNNRINAGKLDVTDEGSVREAFLKASEIAPVDILVNNAGIAMSAPFHKTGLDDWNRTIAVNLTGTYLTIKTILDEINKSDHGRIINIASIAALEGAPYTSAYSASKHGVLGLTRSLALELENVNTTINAICPAFVNTDIVEQAIINIMEKTGRSREESLQGILKTAGQKSLIEPEEVAEEVIKLCIPEADNINGTAIVIDGK